MTDRTMTATDTITLSPAGSVFLLFSDNPFEGTLSHPFTPQKQSPVQGPWTMTFETTGQKLTTDHLTDWSTLPVPQQRYYSGHVDIETTFSHKGKGETWIDLGEVHDVATVYVNGICCGTTWLQPHRLDITHAVRRGANTLRVSVVNTWANALLGADAGTPPFDGIWTNGKYRRAEKTLLPSGLLGPVLIETAKHPTKKKSKQR